MPKTTHTLAILGLIILPLATHADADESTLPRTISVSGIGTAAAPPDMASVTCGVVTTAKTAQDALVANNTAMKRVLVELKSKGIVEKDMQTSGFRVYPEYAREQSPRGTDKVNRVSQYRVSNNVSVKIRELSKLGETLDALVQTGSNQISGVEFGIAHLKTLNNEARKNAIADARERAELYAEATGTRVGKVISISEQQIPTPRPMMARMAMAESVSAVPIATGEQGISATVNVMYELRD